MKKQYIRFGVRTNRWNSAPGTAYKTDGETKEQKDARLAREAEIKAANDEYEAFEVKAPADLTKKLDLQKKYFELKGEAEVKNYTERMEALATSYDEAKSATEANYKSLERKHDALQSGFDMLQVSIKNTELNRRADFREAPEQKSFGEMLKEGITDNKDAIRELKKGQSVEFEMKAVADMSFPVNFSTARTSVAYNRPGIIELPKRKVHVRELMTIGGMDNKSTYNFVKEVTGDYLGTPSGSGPAAVEEATLKPQFDLKLVESAVTAQWVAGWLRISRNMLDDVTGMTTFLQSRLPELLLRAEDNQILNGTGVSPQISGITTAGNYTAPTTSATIDIEELVYGIAQLEGYDREATGILLNPKDWYRIWLTKSSGATQIYDLPSDLIARVNGQMFIAGVPVYRSTAIASDKYIIGDWAMGANLILREAPRVEFFYEDGINVRENMVTVRVEERMALPIYGDNYFIYGDFGNS